MRWVELGRSGAGENWGRIFGKNVITICLENLVLLFVYVIWFFCVAPVCRYFVLNGLISIHTFEFKCLDVDAKVIEKILFHESSGNIPIELQKFRAEALADVKRPHRTIIFKLHTAQEGFLVQHLIVKFLIQPTQVVPKL